MALDLADHRREAAAAQPLLEGPERLVGFPGPDQQHPPRIEAERREPRPMEAAALAFRLRLDHPEEGPPVLAGERGEQRRPEAGKEARRLRLGRAEFMQGGARQPAAEASVEPLDAEGEPAAPLDLSRMPLRSRGRRTGRRIDAFEGRYLLPKLAELRR